MQVFLAALGNKYFLYMFIVSMITTGLWARSCENAEASAAMNTYKRQVAGELSDNERDLQRAHKEIGIMESRLTTQEKLTSKWKLSSSRKNKALKRFIKKHKLKIKSMDTTIVSLRQKINGGSTVVTIITDDDRCSEATDKCIISYDWNDDLDRFKLSDPNIFTDGDESFESEQVFKIYGEIYEQSDGSLQTRRLVLKEVTLNSGGKYEPINDVESNIISSNFTYTNSPIISDTGWKDSFRLSPVILGSLSAYPDSGSTRLGLGVQFFSWSGFGINTHIGFSFKDAEKMEHRLGFVYRPTLLKKRLNFAIGTSIGSPYVHFGDRWSRNVDLLFYLW